MGDTGRESMPYPVDAVDPRTAKWTMIANWQAVEGGMRPSEITLTVEREDNFRPFTHWEYNGDWNGEERQIGPVWPGLFAGAFCGSVDMSPSEPQLWESPNAGAFRISYSRNAVGRVIYVDLTSARLYLGNCDSIRVEALRWWQYPLPVHQETLRDKDVFKVAAQIGIAQGGTYDEAVATMLAPPIVIDNATTVPFARWLYPPPYASAFEPVVSETVMDSEATAGDAEEASVYESDDPDFRFVQDQGQSALLNPRSGVCLPTPRIPLTSGRIRVVATQPVVRPIYVGARFILST